MKKLVGYSVSGVGLVLLFLGVIKLNVPFLSNFSSYFTVGGIVLVLIGVVFLAGKGNSKKIKHAVEEVPIYEGTGKKRKIVGYRRD